MRRRTTKENRMDIFNGGGGRYFCAVAAAERVTVFTAERAKSVQRQEERIGGRGSKTETSEYVWQKGTCRSFF